MGDQDPWLGPKGPVLITEVQDRFFASKGLPFFILLDLLSR